MSEFELLRKTIIPLSVDVDEPISSKNPSTSKPPNAVSLTARVVTADKIALLKRINPEPGLFTLVLVAN